MPVTKGSGDKYRIGSGAAMYTSKASAERAYAAYRAKMHDEGMSKPKKKKRRVFGGMHT